jgi:hypothetical protein
MVQTENVEADDPPGTTMFHVEDGMFHVEDDMFHVEDDMFHVEDDMFHVEADDPPGTTDEESCG